MAWTGTYLFFPLRESPPPACSNTSPLSRVLHLSIELPKLDILPESLLQPWFRDCCLRPNRIPAQFCLNQTSVKVTWKLILTWSSLFVLGLVHCALSVGPSPRLHLSKTKPISLTAETLQNFVPPLSVSETQVNKQLFVSTNPRMCKLKTMANISYVLIPTHIIAGEY